MKPNDEPIVSDDLRLEQVERQLQIKQLQVSALLEVTQAINNNLSSDKLFRIYEFILRAQIIVKRLAVYLKDDSLYCICNYGLPKDFDPDTLKDEIIKYDQLVFFEDEPNEKLSEFDLIIPVYHKDKPLAFALLGEPVLDKYETLDEKIKFIRTVTNIIVVAIENKRLFRKQLEQEKLEHELELAAEVQSMLIPGHLPNNEFIEMSAVYLPHHDIGGDYYDFVQLDDENIIFCIADISGKGIAAAMLMANFQAILRTLTREKKDLRELIESLNAMVTDITKGEKFITFFIGRYNLMTRKLLYINAGHNPPVLFSDNKFELLETGCTILGMFEALPDIEIGRKDISPNSILINYTDGLTDLENSEGYNFTVQKLKDFIRENQHHSMAVFNDQLLKKIMEFKGQMQFIDDVSILSCRIK
jgi:phosphoserine phosphatase RsbU/P